MSDLISPIPERQIIPPERRDQQQNAWSQWFQAKQPEVGNPPRWSQWFKPKVEEHDLAFGVNQTPPITQTLTNAWRQGKQAIKQALSPNPDPITFEAPPTPTPMVKGATTEAGLTLADGQDAINEFDFPEGYLSKTYPNNPYADKIEQTAKKYGLPSGIFYALLQHESMDFQPKYVTGYHTDGSGRGIAAIDKKWHHKVTDEQAFDPEFAIDWAGKYFANLVKQHGNVFDALRAYNGGNAYASDRIGWAGRPVSENTQQYADTVLNMAGNLRRPTPTITPKQKEVKKRR